MSRAPPVWKPPIPRAWRCRGTLVHTGVFCQFDERQDASIRRLAADFGDPDQGVEGSAARRPKPAARGLTGSRRQLYSAGFATPARWRTSKGPCGGIGRRARLKIEFRKECWFDSGQGHQAFTRGQMGICATSAALQGRRPVAAPDYFVTADVPISNQVAGFGSLSKQTVLHSSYAYAPEAH